jgi:predicted transposase YbfD/YdcC
MGTQKGIAKLIRMRGANYVLALKKNQGRLYKKVTRLFEDAEKINYQNMIYKTEETFNYDHTRIEKRHYRILPMMYLHDFKKQWLDLNTVIEVKSEVETKEGTMRSLRYYISSLNLKNYKKIAEAIRSHWSVETKLHWKLDGVPQMLKKEVFYALKACA